MLCINADKHVVVVFLFLAIAVRQSFELFHIPEILALFKIHRCSRTSMKY